MRATSQVTDIVLPLDADAPEPEAEEDNELDWCFDDPELTRQLKAVKRGRGLVLTLAGSCAVALGVAIAWVV